MPDYKCTACEQFFDPDYMHDEVTCRECEIKSLRARVAELEAERAELVKDRERLDALASILSSKDIRIEDGFSGIDLVIFDYNGDEVCEHSGKDLRQAIDAAREGE